jgi:peroxiredoxin family protein
MDLGQTQELRDLVAKEVERQTAKLRQELEALVADRAPQDKASFVVFNGDLDRLLAALAIATGAAASGLETTMFFTFWGLAALRRKGAGAKGKRTLKQKMFSMMTPGSTEGMGVSRMNYLGVGARMLRSMMDDAGVDSVEKLLALARELGVKLVACTMSMDVMGVAKEELVDGVELGGAATFLGEASRSRVSLFI